MNSNFNFSSYHYVVSWYVLVCPTKCAKPGMSHQGSGHVRCTDCLWPLASYLVLIATVQQMSGYLAQEDIDGQKDR